MKKPLSALMIAGILKSALALSAAGVAADNGRSFTFSTCSTYWDSTYCLTTRGEQNAALTPSGNLN